MIFQNTRSFEINLGHTESRIHVGPTIFMIIFNPKGQENKIYT